MGYKLVEFSDVAWSMTEERLRQKKNIISSSGSKSSGTINYNLSSEEKNRVLGIFDAIAENDKWTLSTGTVVDDKMRELVENSSFEHPVHSLILDPFDPVWKKYFTASELVEISSFKAKNLEDMSEDIDIYLNSYDQEWESAIDLYNFADNQKHDPVNEFDKKWIKESMLRVSEFFLDDDFITFAGLSEGDILHSVWRFLYKAFSRGHVKAMLGEKCSVAVSLGKNEDRSLEVSEPRPRKSMGAKLDILFRAGIHELGSCEAGKSDVVPVDDKYLDDGLMKLPKTLRDMLSVLVTVNPEKIRSIITVGFLMMGLEMEMIIMDVPVGHSITRISKSRKFPFPTSRSNITVDLIPLLEITWKGKKMMERTARVLNDRKRKAAVLMLPTDVSKVTTLPFSFVRSK